MLVHTTIVIMTFGMGGERRVAWNQRFQFAVKGNICLTVTGPSNDKLSGALLSLVRQLFQTALQVLRLVLEGPSALKVVAQLIKSSMTILGQDA